MNGTLATAGAPAPAPGKASDLVLAAFVSVLLISNIASTKILVLGQAPRIVLASLVAYFAGEFSNSVILSRMKVRTKGRWLFARTIGSRLVGEGLDADDEGVSYNPFRLSERA